MVVALLGVQVPAQAAAQGASAGAPVRLATDSGADEPGDTDLRPVCGTPAPGHAQCFNLRSAYSLPADGSAGQAIAIVDAYDNPNAEADMAVYRAQYGLPPCTMANGCFKKVDQRGGTAYPTPQEGWAREIALDLDMVSAAAPQAHILLVETDDDGLGRLAAAGVDDAVALGVKCVFNFYVRSGDFASDQQAFDASYNHPGAAIVAASGDTVYGVAFPSTLSTVTAVGGRRHEPDRLSRQPARLGREGVAARLLPRAGLRLRVVPAQAHLPAGQRVFGPECRRCVRGG